MPAQERDEEATSGEQQPAKRPRGQGVLWRKVCTFETREAFEQHWESAGGTGCNQAQRNILKDGTVKVTYGCKFFNKAGWERCPWRLLVVYPSDDLRVEVWGNNACHLHQALPGYKPKIKGMALAVRQEVSNAVANGLTPKQIRIHLQGKGVTPLPSDQQIQNAVAYSRRCAKRSKPTTMTTSELK